MILPFSQFAQPPGAYRRLPTNHIALSNAFLASEITARSIEGAMSRGEAAACALPAPAS